MSSFERFDPKRDPTPYLGETAPPVRSAAAVEVLAGNGPSVIVLTGPRRGECHAIGDTPFSIGRDARCGLSLDDAAASRHHVDVTADASGAHLRDLGSTNGTFLNGAFRGATRSLSQGDRFRVGDTELMYVDTGEVRLDDRVEEDGAADRRATGRASSVIFYSSGRIEGRGIVYDVSPVGARIIDASTSLAVGALVQLLPAATGDDTVPPVRGVVVRRDASGFAVRFDPPDARFVAALTGVRD